MNQVLIGLVGGLIGSTLTVVITKLLDLFQSKKTHRYNLEKIFFERKLAAAEVTVINYTILSTAFVNLSTLYQRLNNDTNSGMIDEHLSKQTDHLFQTLNNAGNNVSNSITLYFDFGKQFAEVKVVKDFYTLMASLENLSEESVVAQQNYLESVGTVLETKNHEYYLKTEKNLENSIKKSISSFENFKIEIEKLIQQMRDDMKRFEYYK